MGKGGADLEHVVRVTVGDSGGPRGGPDRKCHITALLHAAYCNELDAVRFLLLQGAKLGSALSKRARSLANATHKKGTSSSWRQLPPPKQGGAQ